MLDYPRNKPWREFPIAVFDLESTGLDVSTERIVEIAVVRINPSGSRETMDIFLNPGRPIPPAATAVSGITDEDLADAPPLRDKIWEVERMLRDCILAGHNALGYDLPLLLNEYARVGIEPAPRPVIDTMLWAKHLQVSKKVGLAAVCQALDVRLERAHRALPDAQATSEILEAMAERLPKTLGELLDRQEALAAEWEAGRGGKSKAAQPQEERAQGGLF